MTLAGRAGKSRRILWAAVLGVFAASAAVAATTERIVNDRNSGLAIGGIDPLAFFTDGAPTAGRPEHEHRHAGVTWRFRNAGNRAAFAADPEAYMPVYGGYDPLAVARGIAVAGSPLLWVISGNRLYLFYSAASRDQFLSAPDKAIAEADPRWPQIMSQLAQ